MAVAVESVVDPLGEVGKEQLRRSHLTFQHVQRIVPKAIAKDCIFSTCHNVVAKIFVYHVGVCRSEVIRGFVSEAIVAFLVGFLGVPHLVGFLGIGICVVVHLQ